MAGDASSNFNAIFMVQEVSFDMSPPRDAMKLQAFFARVGEIDHLIVALGGGSAIGAFKDLDEAKVRAGFDNKFWPYLNAIRHGVGHIRSSGSITLITGAAGRRAIKGTSGLAAVNGALQAIIGPLALEFAPIRVNAVSPGLIATPYWDRMSEDARRAMYESSAASVPVGRVGAPSDVGQAVLFLVSNEFTTGAILTVTEAQDWSRAAPCAATMRTCNVVAMTAHGPSATSFDVRCLLATGCKADEVKAAQNRRS